MENTDLILSSIHHVPFQYFKPILFEIFKISDIASNYFLDSQKWIFLKYLNLRHPQKKSL